MITVRSLYLFVFSCCVSPEAELTLLAFALARGSVAKVLISLSGICEHLDSEYRASSLLTSMASVRLRLLHRNGNGHKLYRQVIFLHLHCVIYSHRFFLICTFILFYFILEMLCAFLCYVNNAFVNLS